MMYPYGYYWQIEDGRVWSPDAGEFVEKWNPETLIPIAAVELGDVMRRMNLPAPPDAEAVRIEAARRLGIIFGARERTHLERLIAEATQEAVELLSIGKESWTTEQAARAAYLEHARMVVKAHDMASKALRAMKTIPDDYANDKYWP